MRKSFDSFCEIYKDFIDEKIAAKVAAAEAVIREQDEEKIKAIQEEAKVAQEEGRKKGIQQGIERGAKEEKIKIAKTMKQKNVKIEDIMSFTGLSKEEIEAIS